MATWFIGTGGSWNNSLNWDLSIPNGTGATATFDLASGGSGLKQINLSSTSFTVRTLNFTSSATTNYQLVVGMMVMQASSGNAQINVSASVAGALANSTASSLTLNLVSNTDFTIGPNATFTINGAITNSGKLTKLGTGTLELNAANTTRTGASDIQAGRVELNAVNALGSGALNIGASGTLDLNGNSQSVGNLTGSTFGLITGNAGAVLTVNQTIDGTVGGIGLGGAIGLTKNGAAKLTLEGANYSGATVINAGTLALASSANSLLNSASVTVNTGATLELARSGGGLYAVNNFSGNGTVRAGVAGSHELTIANGGGLFSGSIVDGAGTMALRHNSTGITYLNGTNTYTGGTVVNAGILLMGAGGTTGTVGAGTVTINGGTFALFRSDNIIFDNVIAGAGTFDKNLASTATLVGNNSAFTGTINVNAGTLFANTATSFGTGAAVNINAGAVMDLSAGDFTFRSLSGAGRLTGHGDDFVVLTVNSATNSTFSGVIETGSAYRLDFIKDGAAKLTLAGINIFYGGVYVRGGTLALAGSGSIESSNGLIVEAAATFDISGISSASTTIQDLYGRGGSIVFGGKTLTVSDQAATEYALTLVGSAGTDAIVYNLGNRLFGQPFNLSGLQFTNWTDGTDLITVNGNGSNNSITGSSRRDTINGGDGDDTIQGGSGADALDGGFGIDTLSYAGSAAGVTVNLLTNTASGGDATGDVISNFEDLSGSAFNDTLTGNAANNTISGRDGIDTIDGGGGSDAIDGGAGADILRGGDGDDGIFFDASDTVVDGGAGNDYGQYLGFIASMRTYDLAGHNLERLYWNSDADHLFSLTQNNDGTRNETLRDFSAGRTFHSQTLLLSTGYVTMATDTYFLNSTRSLVANDWNSTQAYVTFSRYFVGSGTDSNTPGTEDYQDTIYDNGTRLILDLDQANTQSWTQEYRWYDSLGRVDYYDTRNDNGTRLILDEDNGNLTAWTQEFRWYDSLGRVDYYDTRYDTGIRLIVDEDNANNQTWTQEFRWYDTLGRVDYYDTRYDNGARLIVDEDNLNNQSWTQDFRWYDSAGNVDYYDTRFDNGTRQIIDEDNGNLNSWRQRVDSYTSTGLLDTRDDRNDNGTRVVTDYDQGNAFAWNQHIQTFNAAGVLVGDVYV